MSDTKLTKRPATRLRRPFLGCIADDVTGATDLASNLVLGGMRTTLFLGVPTETELSDVDTDAIVIALKSRSVAAAEAIEWSLRSLRTLQQLGVQRFFFKYCSTFDSTSKGNIGPVAEALMDALNVSRTIFCPAFPRNGRTVYQGHLFVHDRLLHESGMATHPLNPMTDANLVRVLETQVTRPVGLLPYHKVHSEKIHGALDGLTAAGGNAEQANAHVIVDACDDHHLKILADGVAAWKFVTGGSGIARFLPDSWRATGDFTAADSNVSHRKPRRTAILSGSCSDATNRQVTYMRERCPTFPLDIQVISCSPDDHLAQLATFVEGTPDDAPVLIYSTSSPNDVLQAQAKFGRDHVAQSIESFFSDVAILLVEQFGFDGFVIAGGETAGAVTRQLGIKALQIGPEICPGVPWTESTTEPTLTLALKSGNFGEEDFFQTALEMLS